MTSFHEVEVICPACGFALREMLLSSVNTFGWCQYSDGFSIGSLHSPAPELRGCSCGAYFLSREAERRAVPEPNRKRRSLFAIRFKSRRSSQPEAPRVLHPDPMELGVLADALSDQNENLPLELEIRLWRYWRGNDERRDADLPIADRGNAERLLHLLRRRRGGWLLVRGQLLRDLGRFDAAGQLYSSGNFPGDWRAFLMRLASANSSRICEMPELDGGH